VSKVSGYAYSIKRNESKSETRSLSRICKVVFSTSAEQQHRHLMSGLQYGKLMDTD